jgi:hypothetical protein
VRIYVKNSVPEDGAFVEFGFYDVDAAPPSLRTAGLMLKFVPDVESITIEYSDGSTQQAWRETR